MDFDRVKERDLQVDYIRNLWRILGDNKLFKPGVIFGPFLAIFLFSTFISDRYGNLVAFSTFMISIVFILISFWMLVWILEKD